MEWSKAYIFPWTEYVKMNACSILVLSVDPLTNDQANVCITYMFSTNHWVSKRQFVLFVYPWVYKAFWESLYKKQT